MNLGGSFSPKRGCPSADDAAASALQTWWFLLFWTINWGLDTILDNPFREREALLSVLDFNKGFMGLNLFLKSHEGCATKALVLGCDGKERRPFDCKTACISAIPFPPCDFHASSWQRKLEKIWFLWTEQRRKLQREREGWDDEDKTENSFAQRGLEEDKQITKGYIVEKWGSWICNNQTKLERNTTWTMKKSKSFGVRVLQQSGIYII